MIWYGKLPDRWSEKKISEVFSERKIKVSDKDFAALSVSKGGIVPQIATVAKSNDSDNRKKVCKGDFVINSRSDRRGSSGVSNYDGSVSLINIVLTPRHYENARYWHYLLKSHSFIEEYYRNGRGIVADLWTTRYSEMKTIYLPVPPREEQDKIVRFLDWKVSQINKLINAKKKEIALLKELHRAAISETVKNCNGTVVRIGRVLKKLNRSYSINDDVLICSNSGAVFFRGNRKLGVISDKEDIFQGVENGDLLIHGMDTWHGAIGISDFSGKCTTVVHVCDTEQDKRYIKYYLQMLAFAKLYKAISNGVRQNTSDFRSWQKAGSIEIVLPSIDDQKNIADFLDKKCAEFENVKIKLEKDISLLSEYRTRLISDVVTGKMDVRGIAVPDFDAVGEMAETEVTDEADEVLAVEESSLDVEEVKVVAAKKPKQQKHSFGFEDAVVLAVLVKEFGSNDHPFTAFDGQKFPYLFHRHVEGVAKGYEKFAAGPYNRALKHKTAQPIAIKKNYIRRHVGKYRGFVVDANILEAETYFNKWFGADTLRWMDQFRCIPNRKAELELLTTVDMAMVELRKANKPITVANVKNVIQSNKAWKAKLTRPIFSDENIDRAIKWSERLFGTASNQPKEG
ncbi:MAG: restriction endonuclease subunit S [Verrucomicrobiota bacterium]|jgi:type I restriction enzyme S subunit|nr:restriction endonuclease subunit S [Verrucomicrobiota bacterium]